MDREKLDLLDRQEFVDRLLTIAQTLSEKRNNACYAINGGWGVGKTFAINMFVEQAKQEHVEGEELPRYLIFRYNCSPYFLWTDYSVPITNPLNVNGVNELKQKIRNRISLCSCVIILSGMYVAYSNWIDFEIDTAVAMGKPIIGVKPWGQERIPAKVQNNADIMVGWNSSSIVEAVREYAL